MKKYIMGFILGIILTTSITVLASTLLASQIQYTPEWKKSNGEDITNVKDAIDELYLKSTQKSSIILVASNWKEASSWNNAGFGVRNYIDESYFSLSANTTLELLKDAKIKVTTFMKNTGNVSNAPKSELFKNGVSEKVTVNTTNKDNEMKSSITLDVKKGDLLQLKLYGGSGATTYYVTTIEIEE